MPRLENEPHKHVSNSGGSTERSQPSRCHRTHTPYCLQHPQSVLVHSLPPVSFAKCHVSITPREEGSNPPKAGSPRVSSGSGPTQLVCFKYIRDTSSSLSLLQALFSRNHAGCGDGIQASNAVDQAPPCYSRDKDLHLDIRKNKTRRHTSRELTGEAFESTLTWEGRGSLGSVAPWDLSPFPRQ